MYGNLKGVAGKKAEADFPAYPSISGAVSKSWLGAAESNTASQTCSANSSKAVPWQKSHSTRKEEFPRTARGSVEIPRVFLLFTDCESAILSFLLQKWLQSAMQPRQVTGPQKH